MDHSWYVPKISVLALTGFVGQIFDRADQFGEPSDINVAQFVDASDIVQFPTRRGELICAPAIRTWRGKIIFMATLEDVNSHFGKLVQIVTDPRFPLRSEVIIGHFNDSFRDALPDRGGMNTALLMHANGYTDSNHYGAPILPCNVWLEEMLAFDYDDLGLLREEWRQRYHVTKGLDPVNERRSFMAAVSGCMNRLHKRREYDRTHQGTYG